MQISDMRHSLSHILAAAVLELYPDTKLGTGPDTDTGFYYDFNLKETITPDSLKKIEKKMWEIIKKKHAFTSYTLPIAEAIKKESDKGQDFKVEIIKGLEDSGETEVSFYKTGDVFEDLCMGPHIENTSEIPKACFKLNNFSAAYWR
jgi:threonyl-tRNA synthetase